MDIPEKDVDLHTFEGPTDSDTANELLARNRVRRMLNTRRSTLGEKGLITNILGNLLIQAGYVTGNNVGLGYGKNEQDGKLYYFNCNDQGYHGIYSFDALTMSVTPVLQNLIDTNGVDILKFDPAFGIDMVDIVYVDNQETGQRNVLLYWIDKLNKGRKTNVQKCIDKTATGYGGIISEDFITAYKQCPVYAPSLVYITDTTRTSNYMYGRQFKATARFYYDDNEVSNYCDWSGVPLAPGESYLGPTSISFTNNGIKITVETGSKLVKKIEIAILETSQTPGTTLPWKTVVTLVKKDLGIADYGTYDYLFFNDGSYDTADQDKINRQFPFMPRVPKIQSLVKIALTYGHFAEGMPSVPVNMSLALNFQPFYLPNDTVSQLNNPSITVSLSSSISHGGLFNTWWTTVTHFIIGEDVKKGNPFVVTAFGGNGQRTFKYTASLTDSATTVASAIKQWLRSIDSVGIGTPGGATVTNETTDGFGNVSWDFTIEAHEGLNAITFAGFVTPVNYVTLLDDGTSVNTLKMGAALKVAVVYDDDDGRSGNANTSDSCLINIPFETEVLLGQTTPIGLQQPIITVSIIHLPPSWARYYRLVRTAGPPVFIQTLIQQVNTVVVANEANYLDMIVGSLFTYQKIHPETVIAYQFVRGDRLRLIADESTTPPTPYSPLFETEILSYSIDTEEFVDSNIVCDGTNVVTPQKAVDPNYIGKYIIINNIQRLIVGITGPSYELDFNINPNTNDFNTSGATTSNTYPNYSFKDTRGIIRIKLPPPGYTVVALAKVEVYRPQQNVNNENYQDFLDFQQKFEISNWGTPNAAHIGNVQNQDPDNPVSTPALVQFTNGDAYVRNRAMPSNNQDPNPQVIVDQVCDPNYSDFYVSNLYNTGRIYPQDRGFGQVNFGSRVRFSNNYIQDTQINGLNDFDEQDFVDYNDAFGDITLSKFKRGVLYLFKQLITSWTHVFGQIITDNSGNQLLATSDKLLNELQYSEYIDGGIGDNAESYIEEGDFMYIASATAGVFLRIGQDGSIPISEVYFYDNTAKQLLDNVATHGLDIPGGYDKMNGEIIWTIPDFINYIFNNKINIGDWQTILNAYPGGTTWAVTQQPANSTATVVGSQIQITGTNTLGADFFKFQGTLPAGGGTTPIMNFCFTVISPPNREVAYRKRTSSVYCLQGLGVNNGLQGWYILEGYYTDDNSLTGFIMANTPNVAPEAIVPDGTSITYNQATNVSPSGGADGDVWYNGPANNIYKKVAGVWSILTNLAINSFYAPPITNTTACPIPAPTGHFSGYAEYGMTINDIADGTATGVPGAFTGANIPPHSGLSAVYTTLTNGTIIVTLAGTPAMPGQIYVELNINGVQVDKAQCLSGTNNYTLNSGSSNNSPIPIQVNMIII